MSISLFNVNLPAQYRGLEDTASPENYDFAVGLVGRLDVNTRAIINAIRAQCVTDEALVAAGAADAAIATDTDVEGAQLETLLWVA